MSEFVGHRRPFSHDTLHPFYDRISVTKLNGGRSMNTTKEKTTCVRCERRQADGNEYEYTLTVRESDMTASFRLPLYSVRVAMTTADGQRREAELSDAFRSPRTAFSFFNRIVENLATPIDLPFVYDDECK